LLEKTVTPLNPPLPYAWGENIGWINFNGVKISPATGTFSGMAWGENIGWINFAPNGKPVKTSWRGQYLVTLLVPNGGDVLPSGGTYAICWQAPSNASRFDLFYSLNNGTSWNPIKTGTGPGCLHWEIPVVTANKKKCRVKVIGYDSNGMLVGEDISDKPFTIEVARITSPNGGEVLSTGSTWNIKWEDFETIRPVAKTKLFYSTNGGNTWNLIKTLKGDPGLIGASYSWTVPSVSSTKCKVKVVLKDASGINVGKDVSDKVFTIGP
jgi:hypothetical protein